MKNQNQLDSKGFETYNPYASACSLCTHFCSVELNCSAFPNVVPDKFLSGERIHDTVESDQVGNIVFTQIQPI